MTVLSVFEILVPYGIVRRRTHAVRTGKVILDIIGVCTMMRRPAQLQIAAENEQFEDRIPFRAGLSLVIQGTEPIFSKRVVWLDFQITVFI